MTIKLMSVHIKPITCCQFGDNALITGSEDGCIKFTDPNTLEVGIEFYKPKKVIHSILYIK